MISTEQRIYNTAIRDGMPPNLAELMVYQSQHETDNYQHKFFTVGHNAFGYSYSKGSKWQLDKGGPNADNGVAIAQYKSVEDSVHEMTDWIKRRQNEGVFPKDLSAITTIDQYTALLKQGKYYGDSIANYAAGMIRFFYSTVKNFKQKIVRNPGTSIAIGILALAIGYGTYLYISKGKKLV